MSEAIQTEDLVKRFATLPFVPAALPAVAGLDLAVPAGGITGLLGPNGAGKTTVVKILLGLARATSGSATVLGRDAWRESLGIRREVAFVPEERAIFGWMRVADFVAGVAALSEKWDATVATRLATRWQIDLHARLRHLSLGARSRLLLLVALARRAPLLVLDEPTTGLDPAGVDDALSEFVAAAADGRTVLLVTHRLDEVERICDHLVVLDQGRAVLQGNLDEIRAAWRMVEVAGHPNPERLGDWDEVVSVTRYGEHLRLLVQAAPEAVTDRIRQAGAEVLGSRPVSLREIYFSATGASPAG